MSPTEFYSILYAKNVECRYGKIRGKMIVCYDPKKKNAIREARYDEIVKAQENFSKRKNAEISKHFTSAGKIRKAELESMYYKIYFSDKKKKHEITKTVTLSKHQESILKAVDKKLLKKTQ